MTPRRPFSTRDLRAAIKTLRDIGEPIKRVEVTPDGRVIVDLVTCRRIQIHPGNGEGVPTDEWGNPVVMPADFAGSADKTGG